MTETNKTQSSSIFNWCGCGDQEKNKEVYVDIEEKKPVSTIPLFSTPIQSNVPN